ncbi:MAG: DNA polymerase III subunit beta [Chlamydiae bacterium]|nr:DNA polymerase III subunit beta [Chlamydiota bacterium]
MKALINRIDFVELIGKIQSVVAAKPSIPVLANILLELMGDELIISATDLTVSMRASCSAKVEKEGAIALPARRLFQLVRELTTPQIEIELSAPETAMIHAGSSHFKIQGMHKSEFPSFPDLSEGHTMEFTKESLKEMLYQTAFAAARDDSRQVLNGVLMQKANSHATFIGTDGKRLARNQVQLPAEEEGAPGAYIIPLKAVDEMAKILDDKEGSAKLTIMPEKIGIEVGPVLLITKLLTGEYPDVTRVIPKKGETPITLHREELIALLKQVALFTSEMSSAVRFSFAEGALHLSATSGEIGEGKVSMPVNYSGPKLEIAFNPHYFIDILRHSKDETVEFNVTDSYNPGLITDSSKAEFVIMPMRLDG